MVNTNANYSNPFLVRRIIMPTISYPSAVFGYIAFTDPQTNERYLPVTGYDANNHPVSALLVDFSVVFRTADGNTVRANYANAQGGLVLPIKEDDSQNPI